MEEYEYTFITPQEIAQKRRSIEVGQRIRIPLKSYDAQGNIVGMKMHVCPVVYKTRSLVIFRKPSGFCTSYTYVELCMLDRGKDI